MLLFSYLGSFGLWLLAPFLIVFGIGYGGNVPMRAALLREQFGRSSFGSIHGLALGVMQLGAMIGPPVAGWFFDRWQSYEGAWLVMAAVSGVAVFVMAGVPAPKARVAPVEE